MHQGWRRAAGMVVGIMILATGLSAPATAAAADAPTVVAGLVAIVPGVATNTPEVTLTLRPPTGSDGTIRVSNDGATWVERPFATSVSWSLVDPAAGGVDVDGTKQVWVQYGADGTWDVEGTATVALDRVAPDPVPLPLTLDGPTWRGTLAFEGGAGDVTGQRVSLDGVNWQPWAADMTVDLWRVPGAGTWWAAGGRDLWVQVRDWAGNEGVPVRVTTTATSLDVDETGITDNLQGVTFSVPQPAIIGQPFTIHVNYPPGYVLPSNAWCQWLIHWGDDASIRSTANPTWGELFLERPKTTGACTEWTFTLPYRSARQFSWAVQIGTKTSTTEPMELARGIYTSNAHVFRALDGGTDPRFLASTLPFAYVLPDQTVAQEGDQVTYRLHVVGTTSVPQSGQWWAYPLNCYLNPHLSQDAGNTFTYRPTCNGPWVTGWTGTMYKGFMRSQYDPLVDGRAPVVTVPRVRLRVAAVGTSAPATIAWSGRDTKGSGVYRYELQVSRNGGSWQTVTLPNRLSTSVQRALGLTGTYRFRVRARDRVGNWSGWTYTDTVRATTREESSTATRWSGAWSTIADAQLSGGKAKATTAAGTNGRITTTARSLGWVTRKGPGRGLAQVWVDGVLATTVDLGAPSLSGKLEVYSRSWATAGMHTLRIVPLGTLGRPLVEVDAFLVIR